MVDAETLRELVHYDPASGVFTWRERDARRFARSNQWKNWNNRFSGAVAGSVGPKGYRGIAVFGHVHRAHRLAWLYVHGEFPAGQIDHINGERDDNRIANLRDVSGATNARNRKLNTRTATGRLGVTKYEFHGRLRYVARLRADGHLHHLGYFDTVSEAAAAREAAEAKFGFGKFSGVA